MLYGRDYFKLTEEEIKKYQSIKPHIFGKNGEINMKYAMQTPKAIHHNRSLFPNHMLDLDELEINERTTTLVENFLKLLDNKQTNERAILNYIREHHAHFIIASIFKRYTFGHHEAFAFPEFELPPNFRADYLLVGKSSHGYEFIFVELESPNDSITTKDGSLGTAFRKGLKQIDDWESWLEANFSHLRLVFEKYQNMDEYLPQEFLKLDTTRIHYVVVSGRRKDFNDATYKTVRKRRKSNNTLILHYDNLIDSTRLTLEHETY